MNRIVRLMCACVLLFSFSAYYAPATQAQMKSISKEREKKYKSLYKDKVKELKKEGWKIAGSSKTLEVALLDHYEQLLQDGNQEMVGEVSRTKSNNIGRQRAIANAQNEYATLAAGNIRGRVTNEITATDDVESEVFIAAYEKYVRTNVGAALKPSFAIVRENDDKTKEYRLFFILNPAKALAARQNALAQAVKEVQLSAKVANEISEFINEDFPVEE